MIEAVRRAVGNWWSSMRRRVRMRFQQRTDLGRALTVLETAALTYCALFILLVVMKERIDAMGETGMWLLVAALIAVVSVRLLPKQLLVRKRWRDEEVRIAEAYGTATKLVTGSIGRGVLTNNIFDQVVSHTLRGIMSEIERMFSDSDGSCFNCFLWEEDSADSDMLRIISTAKREERLAESYPKYKLWTWHAMNERRAVYDADRISAIGPWRRYRSVLAFPLRDAEDKVIAGISVKSVRPHHFDGEGEAVYATLQPGFLLLILALECRSQLGIKSLEEGEW